MIKLNVSAADIAVEEKETLTEGRVGLQCRFSFTDEWAGLAKTAVFDGADSRDVIITGDSVTVPAECLAAEGYSLSVGVYGKNSAGDIVIPTVYATVGKIQRSAWPSGKAPAAPTPDVVAQIQQAAANAEALARSVREDADLGRFQGNDGQKGDKGEKGDKGDKGDTGDPGEDGGWYTPAVTQPDSSTMRVSFSPSREDMPEVDPAEITLPSGGTGLTSAEKTAMLTLFKAAAYTADVSGTITSLETLWGGGGESGGGETEVTLSSISAVYSGGDVTVGTDVTKLSDIVVTATYSDGSTKAVTDYTLSGTIAEGSNTITVSYGGKTTTFTVTGVADYSAEKGALLYNWDFKKSLTDTVGGITATLSGAEQTVNGLIFDAAVDNVVLGNVFGFNKVMEIDVASCNKTDTTVSGIVFWTNQKINYGFGWNKTAQRFGYYADSSGGTTNNGWYNDTVERDVNYLNGCTLQIAVDSNGVITIACDGVKLDFMSDRNNISAPYYTDEQNIKYITLGSTKSAYPALFDSVITGVRIYEGVQ